MTQDAMKWLQEVRRLDGALLADMGVKAVDHPSLGPAAAFPYRRGGEGYAAKFRAPDRKDWRSTQGVSRGLYNADCLLSGETPVVITEGEIDALSCMQAGYLRAVSLPDGWTEDAGKREVLVEAEALLPRAPYIIVAGDNDTAGSSLPRTVANILEGMDVRRADWPDGCKDANDVLVAFGEGRLAECLTAAKRIDPAGGFITGITDLPPLPERRVLRAGMRPYDHVVAFEVGTMSVVTGTPGSGKSTFTTFAAFHVAQNEQVRVGILAFETHPYRIRDHLSRLYAKQPWADLSEGQWREAGQFLDHHFRVVHRRFDETEHHLEWLRQMIYALAVRDGCKLIVVDPWNELEHLPETGESTPYEARLVPRYVFARFTDYPAWDVVQTCRWLSRVVGVNGEPLPVTDEVMGQMAMVPERLEIIRCREAEKRIIRPGDKARVIGGALDGWVVDVSAVHAGIASFIVPLLGQRETRLPIVRMFKISVDG